jgi:energy-coupling factor transporter ATP-binding protein EcfA2
LVLDEPTNHLDIPSKETLEEAIRCFEGAVIAVSHDRYFLKRIATRVLLVRAGYYIVLVLVLLGFGQSGSCAYSCWVHMLKQCTTKYTLLADLVMSPKPPVPTPALPVFPL